MSAQGNQLIYPIKRQRGGLRKEQRNRVIYTNPVVSGSTGNEKKDNDKPCVSWQIKSLWPLLTECDAISLLVCLSVCLPKESPGETLPILIPTHPSIYPLIIIIWNGDWWYVTTRGSVLLRWLWVAGVSVWDAYPRVSCVICAPPPVPVINI